MIVASPPCPNAGGLFSCPGEVMAMTQPTSQIKRAVLEIAIRAARITQEQAIEAGKADIAMDARDRIDVMLEQWLQADS
jgi:hypothetical protein